MVVTTAVADRDYSAVLPAGQEPAPSSRRPSRLALLAGLVALAIAAVVTMAAIFALSDSDPRAGVGAGAQASQTAQAPSSGVSATSDPGAVPQAPVPPVPPVPPATDSPPVPGLTAVAALRAGDVMEVTESVYWPDGGPSEIVLTVPELSSDSGVPAGVAVSVRALQVSVDGEAVAPIPGGGGDSWTVVSPGGRAPELMEIRYLVDGALVRSTPSQPGRAVAVIAPLSQSALGSLPVTVSVISEGVLSVACTGSGPAPVLCGQLEGDVWTATPAGDAPTVIVAQLDLSPIA